MTWTQTSRHVFQMGFVLLGAAIVASFWQLLATQLPDSPLHAGVLPGPVDKLREWCLIGALVTIALALGRAGTGVTRERPRATRWLMAGVSAVVLSLTYGAATGMPGEQILDPRLDAQAMIAIRMLGLFTAIIPSALLAADSWNELQEREGPA